ncbi:MAG: GNAT family N-acetyltransferase [Nocardioidaceae bacterium]|nr:GNAT family N-acetyltransferase [Nocardioidaceae bacterium]
MQIRPMTLEDTPAVEELTAEAFHEHDVRTRPADWPVPHLRSASQAELRAARLRHLVARDPAGCWVAIDSEGAVVGAAAALLRDGLWGLSTYAVHPGVQARGIGKQLFRAALSYAPEGPGLICSSHDPRAVRRYRLGGFDIHPAMLMWGKVDRSTLPRLPHGREGGPNDIEFMDGIDREARGAGHGEDHEVMLSQFRLKIVETPRSRAYVYIRAEGGPYLLAATDEAAARKALWASLAESDAETPIDSHSITGHQAWAIDVGLAAGMQLHNRGYVATRAMAAPAPYIPSGHFL